MHKLLILNNDKEVISYFKEYCISNYKDIFEVHSCLTCQNALSKLSTSVFNLILCDVNLIDGSGLEIMKLVLENYKNTKILMFSKEIKFEEMYEIQKSKVKFISVLESLDYVFSMIKDELEINDLNSFDFSDNTAVVDYLKDYINKNYSLDFSLDDLAALVYMNPCYLSRLFKKITGTTIVKYITDVRIEHAYEFLKNPEYKLKDIYKKVGYSSPKYFNKVFKQKSGITPMQYRRNIIK